MASGPPPSGGALSPGTRALTLTPNPNHDPDPDPNPNPNPNPNPDPGQVEELGDVLAFRFILAPVLQSGLSQPQYRAHQATLTFTRTLATNH